MTATCLDISNHAAEAGISTIPIATDGTKQPAFERLPKNEEGRATWAPFQNGIPGPDERQSLFGGNTVGIAAIGGRVSGNLENLDFDDLPTFEKFCALLVEQGGQELLRKLVETRTPRPGAGLVYRSEEPVEGNQVFAQRIVNGKPKPLIESRAEGGYFLFEGCPLPCHKTGRPYKVMRGDIFTPPIIPVAERTLLLDTARSLNEYIEPAKTHNPQTAADHNGERPGDDFNARMTWREILEPKGWKLAFERSNVGYWRRPGKNDSWSATTNFGGSDLLHVFSSSTIFESGNSYSKFAAYALLHHNGDYKAAAKELASKGYGKQEPLRPADDPQASRAGEPRAQPEFQYIEFAPTFLSLEDPPVNYLVSELVPEGIIALSHGDPRTRKSWAALEMAVAVSTGTPAFGMERFRVSKPLPVLYSSQEDAAPIVRPRTKAILQGRGITDWPETLAFSVHKGINLESHEWHEQLIRDVLRYGFRLVILDPIRRYAPNADKGPAEVRAITQFLRRLTVETGATVKIVHHDVKPKADNRDDRRRSHKASGGDWFAAAECPIAFEAVGENRTLVIPEDYKISTDPEPFSFKLETDDPRQPTWARLIGETSSAEDAKTLALTGKVRDYLQENSTGASQTAIAKHCRARKDDVIGTLEAMLKAGEADCYGGGGRGKKQTWFMVKKDEKN